MPLEYFPLLWTLAISEYIILEKKLSEKWKFKPQRLDCATVLSYREQRELECWGKRENRPSLRICPFLCGSESVNVMAVAGLSGVKSVVSLRSLWTWMSHMRIEGRTMGRKRHRKHMEISRGWETYRQQNMSTQPHRSKLMFSHIVSADPKSQPWLLVIPRMQ